LFSKQHNDLPIPANCKAKKSPEIESKSTLKPAHSMSDVSANGTSLFWEFSVKKSDLFWCSSVLIAVVVAEAVVVAPCVVDEVAVALAHQRNDAGVAVLAVGMRLVGEDRSRVAIRCERVIAVLENVRRLTVVTPNRIPVHLNNDQAGHRMQTEWSNEVCRTRVLVLIRTISNAETVLAVQA
jgi:hypothetical protein